MKMTLTQYVEAGATVRKLVDNPYREGTKAWTRFDAYKNGKTVAATLEDKKVDREGFRWDVNTGVIDFETPAKKSRKAKAEKKEAAPAPKRSRKAKSEATAHAAA